MQMPDTDTFLPTWFSPPGDTIADLLETRGWSFADLGQRLGVSGGLIDELRRGAFTIDAHLAEQLHLTLGPSAAFWIRRERQYRADLARHTDAERAESLLANEKD